MTFDTPKELFSIIKILTSLGITKINDEHIKGDFEIEDIDKKINTPKVQPLKIETQG